VTVVEVDILVVGAGPAGTLRGLLRPLPGRDAPVGQPGGAEGFSPVWVDTELVQDIPLRDAG
jgi:hypothetical protein